MTVQRILQMGDSLAQTGWRCVNENGEITQQEDFFVPFHDQIHAVMWHQNSRKFLMISYYFWTSPGGLHMGIGDVFYSDTEKGPVFLGKINTPERLTHLCFSAMRSGLNSS